MESQPQNPEFRIDPENSHPCMAKIFPKRYIGSEKKNKKKWA